MNRDELKGKADNLKGRAKEAAGSLTGDKELQAEGMAQRGKGAVQEKVGEVERKVDRKLDQQTDDDTE